MSAQPFMRPAFDYATPRSLTILNRELWALMRTASTDRRFTRPGDASDLRRMTLCEALRDRLVTLPAVTAIIGTRIYTLKFPQSRSPRRRCGCRRSIAISTMHLRGDDWLRRSRVPD